MKFFKALILIAIISSFIGRKIQSKKKNKSKVAQDVLFQRINNNLNRLADHTSCATTHMFLKEILSNGYTVPDTEIQLPLTRTVPDTNCFLNIFGCTKQEIKTEDERKQEPEILATAGKIVTIYITGKGMKNHYFTIFKQQNTANFFFLQSFQGIYTLAQWLTYQGLNVTMQPHVFTEHFFTILSDDASNINKMASLRALIMPVAFRNDNESVETFEAWWNATIVNERIKLSFIVMDLPENFNRVPNFPDLNNLR